MLHRIHSLLLCAFKSFKKSIVFSCILSSSYGTSPASLAFGSGMIVTFGGFDSSSLSPSSSSSSSSSSVVVLAVFILLFVVFLVVSKSEPDELPLSNSDSEDSIMRFLGVDLALLTRVDLRVIVASRTMRSRRSVVDGRGF